MKKKLILIVSQSLLVWSVCFFPLLLLPNRLAVRLPSWSISSISPSISRILGLIASSVVCLATLLCFWDGSSGAIVGISVLSCRFWCAGGRVTYIPGCMARSFFGSIRPFLSCWRLTSDSILFLLICSASEWSNSYSSSPRSRVHDS